VRHLSLNLAGPVADVGVGRVRGIGGARGRVSGVRKRKGGRKRKRWECTGWLSLSTRASRDLLDAIGLDHLLRRRRLQSSQEYLQWEGKKEACPGNEGSRVRTRLTQFLASSSHCPVPLEAHESTFRVYYMEKEARGAMLYPSVQGDPEGPPETHSLLPPLTFPSTKPSRLVPVWECCTFTCCCWYGA
jgi:hypothetical protein